MASDRALYVVSDVHGHLDKLTVALEAAGLIDGDGGWVGGNARLWFLGDLFDRGTDGAGIVGLIMRLSEEAKAEGGVADSLLGNHEVLMLGAQRFGAEDLEDEDGNSRNFDMWWHLNGGQDDDVAKLTDEQINWVRNRPAMAYVSDHLLMHTDTTEYAAYGRNISAVNRTIRKILKSGDHNRWWELFRRLTIRHRFEAEDGPDQAAAMLDFFGGSQIVHGHSTIPDRLGIPGDQVNGARLYCDDLVLNVDGGVYQGGPCLVVPLPVPDSALHQFPSEETDSGDEPETVVAEEEDVADEADDTTEDAGTPEAEAETEAEDKEKAAPAEETAKS
ncbi:MAG TPA: metallophosphoesterase [Stackebrandtia sp.]|jgi:hypothetical protein|uniref:metallophosphoesterase n=1 Tax=Stackebrandtia sp. TaxID=2023065 RepID=UPI002D390B3B|nr:metallophosphoesterase [Stackebrandtia sp.]HZE38354.1 metallophosphoesterase [Stackebrandtia sp.]